MCTDLLVAVPENNVAVVGRSMDWTSDMNSRLKYRKAGDEFTSLGRGWTIQHNYVSVDVGVKKTILGEERHLTVAADGLNDKGFTVGALWFDTAYFDSHHDKDSVNMAHLIDYLLGNYTLVQDVLNDINSKKLKVWAWEFEYKLASLHFSLHDATGATGILEFEKDKILAEFNNLHVCTNSPPIDWHLNNLAYYSSLSFQAPTIKLNDVTIASVGAGLRGIPGDSYPASRFVRAFYLTKYAVENAPPKDANEGAVLVGHLLNSIEVTRGQSSEEKIGNPVFSYTPWIVVKDLVNCILYYKTYHSFSFAVVDLKTADFSSHSVPLADIPAVPVTNLHYK